MTEDELYRYVSCRTTAEEEEAILRWLHSDPANERLLSRVHRRHDLAALSAPLINDLYEKDRRRSPKTLLRRWSVAAASLAAALLVAFGGYHYFEYRALKEQGARLTTLTVPAGQHIEMTLPDGTKVWLNAGTTLEYPALFPSRERRVRIDGEARFDVTHDAAHPFVVETYLCDVRVLGTEFNVLADKECGTFTTALFEGRVEVRNRSTRECVTLRPQEQVHLDGDRLAVGRIVHGDDYLWTEGYINFKGHTFHEIIDRYRHVWGVEIRLVDVTVPETEFRWGKIHIQDGIDNAMKVLQNIYPITYDFDTETRTIVVRNR